MFPRCDRCGRVRPRCLRFGTLAPGHPCGLSHYADALWLAPLVALTALGLALQWIGARAVDALTRRDG
jgi:hypothetical protein